MPEVKLTTEQHAEAGAQFADLKAQLHDAEQHVTKGDVGAIDFPKLVTRLKALLALLALFGHDTPPAPTPNTDAARAPHTDTPHAEHDAGKERPAIRKTGR